MADKHQQDTPTTAPVVKTVVDGVVTTAKIADNHTVAKTVMAGSAAVGIVSAAEHFRSGEYDKASRDMNGVALTGAIAIAQRPETWEALANAGLKGARAIGEDIPFVGGFIAGAFGVAEIGSAIVDAAEGKSSWKKVGSTAVANVAETAAGFVGLGQVARQGVVEISNATLGKENSASDAAAISLIKTARDLIESGVTPSTTASADPMHIRVSHTPASATQETGKSDHPLRS